MNIIDSWFKERRTRRDGVDDKNSACKKKLKKASRSIKECFIFFALVNSTCVHCSTKSVHFQKEMTLSTTFPQQWHNDKIFLHKLSFAKRFGICTCQGAEMVELLKVQGYYHFK